MKRIITVITVLLAAALSASAQPKSAGLRFGATGIDASYQHITLNEDEFIECNLGLDFGAKGKAGFKIACAYNIVLARPHWTDSGSWTIYAGPAATIGNVYDMVTFRVGDAKVKYADDGFLFACGGQAGVEYCFSELPIEISADIRPMLGTHTNDGKIKNPTTGEPIEGLVSKSGFYTCGLKGLIPHISVRYRF